MSSIIEDLTWRYATKKFDDTKKIAPEAIEVLKNVLQLVPTSYGLQPLKYLFIENPTIRQELLHHSFGQQVIVDASHLLVICSYKTIEDHTVDSYIETTALTRQIELEKILGFGDFIKKTVGEWDDTEVASWTSRQAYIALGFLLQSCAQLRIDSTPMEGFKPAGYDEVLNLSARKLTATLVIPIGYRHDEDGNQHLKKVRRSFEELFEVI